ncbi:hypothetical protein BBBOND_0400040 [Babesia bigemina]|uniref:Uncharacterized protein n=1 Tax=Babesia bigemina TaxID=5866 RepID=A0A061DAD2_BABBI|nr:hypothetical protein BBBOND_0400040 [Babesia bigemina]CDR97508.1 hypothetical protein BBBOND_0400040 [Babesia bigemina]|eukprot:XP_012769694.1 hypothetical protein BBBOND_0400040 [Babesia bigemina]
MMCTDVVFCNSYATIHSPVGGQHGARQVRGPTRKAGELRGKRVHRSGARGTEVRERKANGNKQKGKWTCMKGRGVSREARKRMK